MPWPEPRGHLRQLRTASHHGEEKEPPEAEPQHDSQSGARAPGPADTRPVRGHHVEGRGVLCLPVCMLMMVTSSSQGPRARGIVWLIAWSCPPASHVTARGRLFTWLHRRRSTGSQKMLVSSIVHGARGDARRKTKEEGVSYTGAGRLVEALWPCHPPGGQ